MPSIEREAYIPPSPPTPPPPPSPPQAAPSTRHTTSPPPPPSTPRPLDTQGLEHTHVASLYSCPSSPSTLDNDSDSEIDDEPNHDVFAEPQAGETVMPPPTWYALPLPRPSVADMIPAIFPRILPPLDASAPPGTPVNNWDLRNPPMQRNLLSQSAREPINDPFPIHPQFDVSPDPDVFAPVGIRAESPGYWNSLLQDDFLYPPVPQTLDDPFMLPSTVPVSSYPDILAPAETPANGTGRAISPLQLAFPSRPISQAHESPLLRSSSPVDHRSSLTLGENRARAQRYLPYPVRQPGLSRGSFQREVDYEPGLLAGAGASEAENVPEGMVDARAEVVTSREASLQLLGRRYLGRMVEPPPQAGFVARGSDGLFERAKRPVFDGRARVPYGSGPSCAQRWTMADDAAENVSEKHGNILKRHDLPRY